MPRKVKAVIVVVTATLADQILEEHECEVAFVSQVKESEKQDRWVLAAEVHCQNRRSFDAIHNDDFELFEFDECEPPETKSC